MKKNKDVFDEETLKMFEAINKHSREAKKEDTKMDYEERIDKVFKTVVMIILFALLILLMKVSGNIDQQNIKECKKNGYTTAYCVNQ